VYDFFFKFNNSENEQFLWEARDYVIKRSENNFESSGDVTQRHTHYLMLINNYKYENINKLLVLKTNGNMTITRLVFPTEQKNIFSNTVHNGGEKNT